MKLTSAGLKISDTEKTVLIAVSALLLFPSVSRYLARAAVTTGTAVATGAIEGAGEVVGIPVTDQNACIQSLQADDTWNSSFDCPAPIWGYSLFHDPAESVAYARKYYADK